jgi:hypothetical protein
MRRGVVDMKMSFLDTLSVVSLRIGQSEQTFLEEFIFLVPKAKGNILESMCIRDAGDAIFSPSESSRSGVLVWKVYVTMSTWVREDLQMPTGLRTTPGVAIRTVILSDCGPLALSDVGAPFLPVLGTLAILLETLLLLGKILVTVENNHCSGAHGQKTVGWL